MSSRAAVVLAALSTTACGAALTKPPEPSRELHFKVSGATFSSSNGFVYAVLPDPHAGVVRVDVRYPVGSADDPAGKEGLAHLVEHLLFEVSVTRGDRSTTLGSYLAEDALANNAVTTPDYTDYMSIGMPSSLEKLLRAEVERGIASCKSITPEVFEREKEVVENELRERLGADGGDLYRQINDFLYPKGHPYARLNSLASVKALTLDDVCAFMDDQYRRGPATVVITGRVDPAEARQLIGRYFARVPSRKPGTDRSMEPVTVSRKKIRLAGDVQEPYFMMAWPLPPENTRDYRFVMMAASLLQSRMEAFAWTYGWGHSVDVSVRGGERAPFLTLTATMTDTDHFDEARDAAGKAVDYVLRERTWGENREDRTWYRRHMAHSAQLIGEYESLSGRANMFAEFVANDEIDENIIGRLEEVRQASPDDVRKVLEKWLDTSRAASIEIVPGAERAKHLTLAQVMGETHEIDEGVVVDESEADRPLPLPAETGLAIPAERYEAPNGLDVLLWPHGDLPLVHGRLVVHSGSVDEPDGAEGLAQLSGMDDVFDRTMVYWQEYLSIYIDELVSDLTWELRRPGRSVSSKTRDYLKGRLRMKRAAERKAYRQDWLAALYGKLHLYARPGMTPASLDRIDTDAVEDWARKRVVPANTTLILVGKFDSDLVRQYIAYDQDHVSAGQRETHIEAKPRGRTPAWIVGHGRDDASTLDIEIGFAGGNGIGRDYAARLVLTGILDSKLSSLREKLAVSYGFYASYTPRAAGGYWTISGSSDPARAAETGAAIEHMLASLRTGSQSYRAAFVLARRKVLQHLLASSGSAAQITDRLTTIVRFDLPLDFYDQLARQVANLTPADVEALVRAELGTDKQVFGTWGNEEVGQACVDAARSAATTSPPPATTSPPPATTSPPPATTSPPPATTSPPPASGE